MSKILVISGSPSNNSKTGRLAEYVATRLASAQHRTSHIRVRDLPPEGLVRGSGTDERIAAALRDVDEADGIVFVTPTYKASYSGLIKLFIDLLPQSALEDKAVLPLATGGTLAHVLMIDYAFRPILHALGARHTVKGHFMVESALNTEADDLIADERQKALLCQAVDQFARAVASPA